MSQWITELLGEEAEGLLGHACQTIDRNRLSLPGGDFVDRVWTNSDRNERVLRSLATLFGHGRLAGTGYVSILPVDQGVEHSAGASFAINPDYFDPENIVKLAMEGGCNAVAIPLHGDGIARRGPGGSGFSLAGSPPPSERDPHGASRKSRGYQDAPDGLHHLNHRRHDHRERAVTISSRFW